MREADKTYQWQLDYGNIALMWRGGCIIRSQFLGEIRQAFTDKPQLSNLLLNDFFKQTIKNCEAGWRATTQLGIQLAIPLPTMTAGLSFFDGYCSARLPAIYYKRNGIILAHILMKD